MPTRPPTMKIHTADARPPKRVSSSRLGYGRPWQVVRAYHLAHHPLCEDCAAAGRGPVGATEVDHVRSIASGGGNGEENLRSLCKSCHSRKTCAVDGGLGRARR